MKRKMLKDLGLTDEQVTVIMREYGKTVTKWKKKYEASEQDAETFQNELLLTQQKLDETAVIFEEFQQLMERSQFSPIKRSAETAISLMN